MRGILMGGRHVAMFAGRFAVLVLLANLVGCGEASPDAGLGTVTGNVTVDGKMLSEGEVALQAEGSKEPTPHKMLISGGLYNIGRVPPGKYTLFVIPPEAKADSSPIPKKFRSPETSGLTIEVKKGAGNKQDIAM